METRSSKKKEINQELGLLIDVDKDETFVEIDDEEDDDLDDEEVSFSEHGSNSEISTDDSEEENLDTEIFSDKFYFGKDKTTKWSKVSLVRKAVRTKARNLVKILPGPKLDARDIENEIDSFLKIFSIEMIHEIIMYSNKYIDSIKQKFQRERDCKYISKNEMLAFIGLLFLSGMKRANHTTFLELWATDGTGIEIFRACMNYKRFLFILRVLRFDDITTREQRRKLDKLAPIRSILDALNENCKKTYCISEYMTIDEMLVPFRGRCNFIQYIPSKPAKYGIKMFALCDAKSFFTSKIEIYCGKQPDGPYFINNTPADIVSRLVDHVKGKNRNLTCDNWYSSYQLAKSLLANKITYLGTLRKNKREIPPEFLPNKKREVGSSLFGFQQEITITSYVPKKNKSVVLISTMHNDSSLNEDTKKPEVIHDYNMTKGGVDTVDQLCSNYSVSRRTKRWPLCTFFHLLNISGINAQILYNNISNKAVTRRLFLKTLAISLMKPYFRDRLRNKSLPLDIKLILKKHVEEEEEREREDEPPPKIRSRCHICGRRKNRVTTMRCDLCHLFVCKEHSKKCLRCKQCSEDTIQEDEN